MLVTENDIPGPAPTAPAGASFTLDENVMLGDTVLIRAGTAVAVRKPDSGALRGLKIASLLELDVIQLEMLAPRITAPAIVKGARMAASDLTQFGMEVQDFLLPKAAKPAASRQA